MGQSHAHLCLDPMDQSTSVEHQNSPTQSLLTIDSKGNVEEQKRDGLRDVVIYEEEEDEEDELTDMLGRRNGRLSKEIITDFPKVLKMKVAFGYDKSVKDKLKTKAEIYQWILKVFAHMKVYYLHNTLQTRIILEVTHLFLL